MKTRHLHIEWIVFLMGLLLLSTMNLQIESHTLCLFEWVGFKFCLGEGLGHSIAYLFQGEIKSSIDSNFMGVIAVFVLSLRIITIWRRLLNNYKEQKMGTTYV